MYKTHTLEEYNKVIYLRKRFGFGSTKISLLLLNEGTYIKKATINNWIYRNKEPFLEKIVKKISKNSHLLSNEKAYVLGVLSGDGCVSTGNRISLEVCDKDFAQFFKICLENVYGLKCSYGFRKKSNPNAKLQYVVSLTSKNIVEDLNQYCKSFKTKEWSIPKQIKNSNEEIVASYLRGLYDSEGSVRFRRNGYGIVQFYSTNFNALVDIGKLLKDFFNIESKVVHRKPKESYILEITYYKDIKIFYDKVNFVMVRKQIKLFQLLGSYKRKGLKIYDKNFNLKCLEMLNNGYSISKLGKMFNFSRTNVYDFIKQKERGILD